MPDPASPLSFPVPLPKSGQSRAWWRAPASGTALACAIAAAARRHPGPLLVVARDNHAAHQLEADLRLLAAGEDGLPVLGFPDWETLSTTASARIPTSSASAWPRWRNCPTSPAASWWCRSPP